MAVKDKKREGGPWPWPGKPVADPVRALRAVIRRAFIPLVHHGEFVSP